MRKKFLKKKKLYQICIKNKKQKTYVKSYIKI